MLDTWRRSIQCALGLLAVSALLPAQTVVFIPQPDVVVEGLNPASLVIGDFNGHRRQDLAVANRGAATIEVLSGVGNGFFQPLIIQDVGLSPRAVATGDFNRDGRLDLVVANFGSGTVSLLLGNGNGTFRPGVDLEALGASALLVGDFNSDGRLDLAVANQSANTVSIFLGDGNGFFREPLTFAVGVGPVWIAAGDFNGDGKTDLLTANAISNTLSVLLGIGDGTFRAAQTFATGQTPVSIALGDFNGDGKLDAAVVNGTNSGTVSVLLGTGNGTFLTGPRFAVGPIPSFIVASDFNLDGKLDLAVANAGDNTVSILMGRGNGIFLPQIDFSTGDAPTWIGVSDLDSDGKPDLLMANSLSNTVSVLMNRTLVPDQPTIADHAVLNGASYQDGSVAPGEVVTIFGSNLGPAKLAKLQLTASHRVDTTLAQTRVLFDGIPAPLFYVRADQISAIVPFGIAGQTDTHVAVERNGIPSASVNLAVSDSAPGLFTANASGKGEGAILNQDLSANSASNPAAPGSIVVLYATGAGQTNPPGVDGELADGILPKPELPVSVTIDGKKAQVLYAGAGRGLVAGVIQVNVRVPDDAGSGAIPVVLHVGDGVSRPGVTLAVQ